MAIGVAYGDAPFGPGIVGLVDDHRLRHYQRARAQVDVSRSVLGAYLNYYYYTPSQMERLREKKRSRAQEALAIEKVLFREYADPRTTSIPEELGKRGGGGYNVVAVNVIEAIANNIGNKLKVNRQYLHQFSAARVRKVFRNA